MELKCKIEQRLNDRSGVAKSTGNPWRAADFLLVWKENGYDRHLLVSVFGEDKLANPLWASKEEVVVFLNLDAHEYNGRWYNDVRAWKVERPQVQQPASQPVPPQSNDDDMPF